MPAAMAGFRIGRNVFKVILRARPHPAIAKSYGGGLDFAWDGTGRDNCVSLPDSAVRRGVPLAACRNNPAASRAGPAAEPLAPGRASGTHHASALDAIFAAERVPAPDLSGYDAVVRIRAMAYEPKHLRVARGASVAWVNDDTALHTVTSGRERTPSFEPLQSPVLARGQVYAFDFEQPGTYEYLCLPHMDQLPMREATVTVE